MEIHPYIQLKMEVDAFRRWYNAVAKLKEENSLNADQFLREMVTPFYWVGLDSMKTPPITKKEKAHYLQSLGCSYAVICKKLHMSPNKLVEIMKQPRQLRHIEQDAFIEALIKEWEPFKALIPKEIFIKYI